MNEIKSKIAKLIDVKSIMTILLTIVFCTLAITDEITSEQFMTIYAVVVSFFFGVKSGKDSSQQDK